MWPPKPQGESLPHVPAGVSARVQMSGVVDVGALPLTPTAKSYPTGTSAVYSVEVWKVLLESR